LADGTYGTQIVNEEEAKSKQKLMFWVIYIYIYNSFFLKYNTSHYFNFL
jgi:hypothetical protein